MSSLQDGTYSVVVLDVVEGGEGRTARVELAITQGEAKGEVVHISTTMTDRVAIDLLGLPGTLNVLGGEPSLRIER